MGRGGRFASVRPAAAIPAPRRLAPAPGHGGVGAAVDIGGGRPEQRGARGAVCSAGGGGAARPVAARAAGLSQHGVRGGPVFCVCLLFTPVACLLCATGVLCLCLSGPARPPSCPLRASSANITRAMEDGKVRNLEFRRNPRLGRRAGRAPRGAPHFRLARAALHTHPALSSKPQILQFGHLPRDAAPVVFFGQLKLWSGVGAGLVQREARSVAPRPRQRARPPVTPRCGRPPARPLPECPRPAARPPAPRRARLPAACLCLGPLLAVAPGVQLRLRTHGEPACGGRYGESCHCLFRQAPINRQSVSQQGVFSGTKGCPGGSHMGRKRGRRGWRMVGGRVGGRRGGRVVGDHGEAVGVCGQQWWAWRTHTRLTIERPP